MSSYESVDNLVQQPVDKPQSLTCSPVHHASHTYCTAVILIGAFKSATTIQRIAKIFRVFVQLLSLILILHQCFHQWTSVELLDLNLHNLDQNETQCIPQSGLHRMRTIDHRGWKQTGEERDSYPSCFTKWHVPPGCPGLPSPLRLTHLERDSLIWD